MDVINDLFQETEYDYSLEVYDLRGELAISLKYNESLFLSGTIQRHLGYFKKLLEGIIENCDREVKDYEIVSSGEKETTGRLE